MAKKIIWSLKAKKDQVEILEYWLKRNKSNVYPQKLFILIKSEIEKLSRESIPRRLTDVSGVGVKIISNYKIFFKEDKHSIFIITIWDTRQDPDILEKILKA